MNKDRYKKRIIDERLDTYVSLFGAVCLEGPKWCGKSWTAGFRCGSQILLGDPAGNFQNRRLAEISPYTVLAGETPRLLDEWQEVPLMWDAVRHEVDVRGLKGQFVLTGSSTPEHKGILHSGAGRYGFLRMSTMTLYETGDSSGMISLKDICEGRLEPVFTGDVDIFSLAKYIIRGGWPGSLDVSDDEAHLFPQSYVKAIVEDDFYKTEYPEYVPLKGVKRRYRPDKMRMLLDALAHGEGTTASRNELRKGMAEGGGDRLRPETINQNLGLLDRMFILDNQPPFRPRRATVRVKQLEKRHFCDPSLACALLGITTPEQLVGNLDAFEVLFKSLVVHDLNVYAESFKGKLYHYQDYRNNAADAVIELDDGSWCAFEIIFAHNYVDDAAKRLLSLRDSFVKDGDKGPSVLCIICGLSNFAYARPDGIFVVPITALKN
ncbi:MAG: DUF4143 domain-containing protein [Clostridia bacterium]|nr:DUF4143 domain-containing protein [Clostridia bacterium]